MKNKRVSIPILILIPLLIAACGAPQPIEPTPTSEPAPEPTAVVLGVGYIPSVQFAPLYVAIEKGYFADEGLTLSLEYGFETDYVKLLALGKREFIIASGDVVILSRSQQLPVTYVAEWYTKYPVVVFSPAEQGVATPKDLVGKTVGIPGLFGTSYVGWKALVHAANLPEEEITLKSVGFNQAAALQEGLVDAAVDYAANGPVQFQMQGVPTNVIVVDDYMHLPSNGLVTNEQTLVSHPERVEGMVRALLRGIADTLANPDEAFEISLKHVPEAAQNPEMNRPIFDASLPYWTPTSPDALGRTDPAIWPATAAFMLQAGLMDKSVSTEGIWTNAFVDKAGVTLP
ncbi:MAG TPA: hypothetical protein EYP25_04650 [Anaerolineae bacterium]|nr:hypothetical protein [Anaerolineae bacterium]